MLQYNALDSACTLQVRDAFWPDLAEGFQPAYDMTLALFPVLTFMQTRGVRVDMKALIKTRDEILIAAKEKQDELDRLIGRKLNINSPKQCKEYFYTELGIPPYYNEGRVTVDDLALQRLSRGTAKRPGLRQARLIQDIRGLQKLHGTYLNIEFDADSRMRCSYNPRGTRFGRLSSSATIFGTGTNMQNLPPEFKRFLTADPGCVFWEVDKRQAEWVVVAYCSGDKNMIEAVESDKDTHVHTATLIFQVEPEVILDESKLVGYETDPERIKELRASDPILAKHCAGFPRTMSSRQCAKKSNHGFNYDEGPAKWSLMNEVELAEGKRVHEAYHRAYPGIRKWYEATKAQLSKDRTLTNCFGRKVRFMGPWDLDLFKAAYSFVPQSTVVDSLNQGMVKIYADAILCGKTGTNLDILAQVHDSILLQVPLKNMHWDEEHYNLVQERVYQYISPALTYHNRTFKIETDSKMGFNWAGRSASNPLGMREVKDYSDVTQLLEANNGQGA